MVRDPRRLEPAREFAQFTEVAAIQRIGRAYRHRHAMHRDWIMLAHCFKYFERASALDHEVFRDDLEPIYFRLGLDDELVMRPSKPDAETQVRKVCALHRNQY